MHTALDCCNAAVFTSPGEPMRLAPFELPELREGETLVQVTCCTVCGSDLHTYQGHRSTPLPTVLGHEIIGRIAAFGPGTAVTAFDGSPLAIGQRVTWTIMASCGRCFYCRDGLPQKCESLVKYGHESTAGRFAISGGLGEFCHLAPGTAIVPLGETLPDEVACPANCATATVSAAFRAAGGSCAGKNVAVFGAGALGLTACAMARVRGAAAVLACDVDPERLALAKRFGATACFDSSDANELQRQLKAATAGRGPDVAHDFSGAPVAMEQAVRSLRIGGTCVLVGAVFATRPLDVTPELIIRRLLTIRGVHNYVPQDLADAVAFLQANHDRYPFAELVTRTFDLGDADAAFRHAIAERAPRVAVRPAAV